MRKQVVVIGGGIAGCSVALHLARAGWKDVLLIEKGELTSGSTHHAAGLVTQFNPSSTMMRLRRYSVALYRELQVFETVGSVRIASGEASWIDLRRAASRAAGAGFEAQLISPDEVLERLPEANGAPIFGGVWVPDDGWVDPHIATYAVADAARALGVEIRIRARVTGIELGPGREVQAVVTDEGRIETEHVVNAAGIWAPQVAAMVGAFLPSIPVDHQHVTMQAVAGHEIPRDAPCFRDTDNLVYGKAEAGGLLVGGYEPNPTARWADGVPWDHGASPVESDMDRFAPLLEGAIRRFPMLEESGVVRLLCHPDAMTPDGNPAARADAGRARLLGRRRPVAERLRRRRRPGPEPRRVDDRGRNRSSTSTPTAPGASVGCTATPSSRPRPRARRTSTTTGCATRSTPRRPAVAGASVPCTGGSRSSARSSV